MSEHIIVLKVQHSPAFRLEIGCPPAVIGAFLIGGVGGAIDLHDETILAAGEVGDVWADRQLPNEFEAIQATSAKKCPEALLAADVHPPKPAGAFALDGREHGH